MTTTTFNGIQRLFTYPFEDAEWKQKLLIASLITFVSAVIPLVVPIIFLAGYCERIVRRIVREDGEPYLPEWDDWNALFVRGFKLFGAGFLYTLPALMLFIGGYALMMIPAIVFEFAQAGHRPMPFGGDGMFFGSMMAGMVAFGLAMVIGLVTGFISPVALMHVVAKDDFSAAFRVREWWPILRANLAGFVLSYVIVMGTSFAANFVLQFLYLTVVLCCLMPFVLSVFAAYMMLVSSALFACAYRDGVASLGSVDLQLTASKPKTGITNL